MANFLIALNNTLKYEGGYVNDPLDPGGETYKGISRVHWKDWTGWPFVDAKNFTEADKHVQMFYYTNFWEPLELEPLEQIIANSVFDTAVNMGKVCAIQLLQSASNVIFEFIKEPFILKVDGVVGPNTLIAYKKLSNSNIDSRFLTTLFKTGRIIRYLQIVEKNPSQKKFFYGWVKRALDV